jgi:hypothetical protein
MDSFVPDLSKFWFPSPEETVEERMVARDDDDPPSPTQREALDQLNERINAARSIY